MLPSLATMRNSEWIGWPVTPLYACSARTRSRSAGYRWPENVVGLAIHSSGEYPRMDLTCGLM